MKLIYNQTKLISIFQKTITCLFFLLLLTQSSTANSNNFCSGDIGRFAAVVKDCEVKVLWNTETEDGIKNFEIEWSGDGESFQKIHSEYATGASPSNMQYIFLDENSSFNNFYRLKIINLDGSFKYSETVQAIKECEQDYAPLTIFPNPVDENSNIINLEFVSTKPQAQILINDMLGRTIQRLNLDVDRGVSNKFELDISNYPAGTYNMIIVGERQAKIFVIK
ncbi:MAG: T9SS type A sorting domain-containing protein [Saprospiraceae bacterium]